MLVPIDVARVDEARMARGMSEIADSYEEIAGGRMCFGGKGSWVNCAIGLGFAGPLGAGEIERVIGAYESRGIEPRVEVNPCADGTLIDGLSARGFVVRMFENTFARRLTAGEPVSTPAGAVRGLRIERVDPADEAAVGMYVRTALSGFMQPGQTELLEGDVRAATKTAKHPETSVYVALVDGTPASAASMATSDGVCALFGTTVLEPFRRRGIQQALIARRLMDGAARGALIATIGSKPGVATERNVVRMGFSVMYTRVVVVLPGEGLTPGPA